MPRRTRSTWDQDAKDQRYCGHSPRTGRLCNRPATTHYLKHLNGDGTGAVTSRCDKHPPNFHYIDEHPLNPGICADTESWWHPTSTQHTGFCFYPHEEKALHEELASLTTGTFAAHQGTP